MTPVLFLLAQIDSVDDAQRSARQGLDWLTQDPTGRWIGLALGLVLVAVALVVFFKMFRWAAARWKMLTAVALLLTAAVYACTYLLDMGIEGLVILGVIALGLFFGFALFATQGGSRR